MILPTVDSTNAEAGRRAAARRPAWIMAGEQTGGRGRRGRPWSSPPGNLYASHLCFPADPPAQVALRSFAAALALAEALEALTGAGAAIRLKWPNDVLLNGGKVAGILLESAGHGARVDHLAIGIGVNLLTAPDPALLEPAALRPVTVLAETGVRLTPEALLDRLAPAFADWDASLTTRGFAPLRAAWLARAARLGERITARTAHTTRDGIFETLDENGALVLHTDQGRTHIPAAEVHFP